MEHPKKPSFALLDTSKELVSLENIKKLQTNLVLYKTYVTKLKSVITYYEDTIDAQIQAKEANEALKKEEATNKPKH